MQKVILLAALAISACGALEELKQERLAEELSFTYGGIDYDHASGSFSGDTVTPVANMPVSGTAFYTGDYTFEFANTGPFDVNVGAGSADLTANFGAGTASLDVSGDLRGTVNGSISGNRIQGNGLDGRFYGTGAEKAAGSFSARDQNGDTVEGNYIVTR